MGRTKGAKNKRVNQPEIVGLEDGQKLKMLADILLEVIFEEGENAAITK
jgi:predicted transcriptional regulator